MNRILIKVTFLVCLLTFQTSCQKIERSNLAIIDDTIPGGEALIYGKGLISTDDYELSITFTPQMDEMYFTRSKEGEKNRIYVSKLVNNSWSQPERVSFSASAKFMDYEAHINPRGDKIFFGSTRPLGSSTLSSGMHQWYAKRTGNGWGNPVPLDSPFADRWVMYITSSENGDLYFTSREDEDIPENGAVYHARKEEGYKNFERMPESINATGKWLGHPYIAPDGSYIIYDVERASGFGSCDLYISFNKDGSWTKSYNLGPEINTEFCEMCPSVSPDGRYLFFHRGDEKLTGNIYWIDFKQVRDRIENILREDEAR